MRSLGLQAYRFSVSWPRVLPQGRGKVAVRGLDFYDRLVDQLLRCGIRPYCTLFHWDYPLALYRKGGWAHPDSPRWFADYAAVVAHRLGDRVRSWMTLNEPQIFTWLGHGTGEHAPGERLPIARQLRLVRNVQLAHGRSVMSLRSVLPASAQIGWAVVGVIKIPFSRHPQDVVAARKGTFACSQENVFNNTLWNDPVILGRLAPEARLAYNRSLPEYSAEDLSVMAQPMDFLGLNIYSGVVVQANQRGLPREVSFPVGNPRTAFHWSLTPEAMEWGPKFLHERYRLPIFITENGLSSCDWVSLDGKVHDPQRIDFLQRYLRSLRQGVQKGAPIRGYFQWSLMDNFEWAEGYRQRFGLIHVDFNTQKRTPKDSFFWYQKVIRSHGASLG
jgi:beta-glucosidase